MRRAPWLGFWLWMAATGMAMVVMVTAWIAYRPDLPSNFALNHYLENRLFHDGFRELARLLTGSTWVGFGVVVLYAVAWQLAGFGPLHRRCAMRVWTLALATMVLPIVYLLRDENTRVILEQRTVVWWQSLPIKEFVPFLPAVVLIIVLAVFLVIRQVQRTRKARHTAADTEEMQDRVRDESQASALSDASSRGRSRLVTLALHAVQGIVILLAALYVGIYLANWLVAQQVRRTISGKPNIIFIMVDTLRADHVGCYGYELPTTPHIDQLAQDSIRFTDAVPPASWTSWSVNGIFSSQYPTVLFTAPSPELEALGIKLENALMASQYSGVPLPYTTLAEVLHNRGYSTNAAISNPFVSRQPGTMQGYDWYDDSAAMTDAAGSNTSPKITQLALRRLDAIQQSPFFLYLLYIDPHADYDLHPEFVFPDAPAALAREKTLPGPPTPAQVQQRRRDLRAYDSEIAYTDHAIGQVLDELKRRKLYDDALIVFFSDHGEEFLDHGGVGHGQTLYQEVIHVPLLVKLPRQRTARVVTGPMALLNLYPSVLAYLGYAQPTVHPLQGQSLDLTSVLKCADVPIFVATDDVNKGIRLGGLKYLITRQGTPEMFNLTNDPRERQNLLTTHLPEVASLVNTFTDWKEMVALQEALFLGRYKRADARGMRDANAATEDDIMRKLRALGYVN